MINSWMSFYSLILVSEAMSNRCRLPSHGGRELKIPKDFFELERFLGTPPYPRHILPYSQSRRNMECSVWSGGLFAPGVMAGKQNLAYCIMSGNHNQGLLRCLPVQPSTHER